MPFRCPKCQIANALDIRFSIELKPDRRSDEISLQVVACHACRFEALAIYAESRRSIMDSETWHHTGYQVSQDAVRSVDLAIKSCPDPHNARCPCPAHVSLGEQNQFGAIERDHIPFFVRHYNPSEITVLLASVGLQVERMMGGYGGEPISTDSRRMVIITRKK